MRKLVWIYIFFISLLSYSEYIEKIDVRVSLNDDKSVHIKKVIEYNPEDELKRGIILDIVYDNTNLISLYGKLGIKNFKVNDNVYKITHSRYYSYRLGKKDKFLAKNKIKKYDIEYDIYNLVRNVNNNSQIFLNVIGNFWNMPIKNVNVVLDFDNIENLSVFTGSYGKNTNNFYITGNSIKNIDKFNAFEGLTFKLDVNKPYTSYNLFINILNTYDTIKYNAILIIIVILCIFRLIYLKKKEDNRLLIKPEFKIDERISPQLASKIANKSKYNLLTITFISLITKGIIDKKDKYEKLDYVKSVDEKLKLDLEEKWQDDKEKIFFIKEKYLDFENIDIELSPSEKIALNHFSRYKDDIFKNIKNIAKLNEKLENLVDTVYQTTIAKKNQIYTTISVFLMVSTILLNTVNYTTIDLLSLGILILSLLIMLILSTKIYVRTEIGIRAYENILGYMLFYENVEENIFKEFNDEASIVAHAKKMLPYMIALGLEAKYIRDLNEKLSEVDIDNIAIYTQIYYPYIYNLGNIDTRIKEDIYRNEKLENVRTSGSNFGGSNFSGGGFSGGGGSSW